MEKLRPWDKNFDIYMVTEKLNEIIDYINEREEEVDTGKEQLTIPVVTKRNWFERLPLHWRYLYYMVGGVIIGLLLPYVW